MYAMNRGNPIFASNMARMQELSQRITTEPEDLAALSSFAACIAGANVHLMGQLKASAGNHQDPECTATLGKIHYRSCKMRVRVVPLAEKSSTYPPLDLKELFRQGVYITRVYVTKGIRLAA